MFLDNLSKDEKEAFICIAHKVMLSNEIIDDDQSKIMKQMLFETDLSRENSELTEKESFKILKSSKNTIKRSVYIEFLSLAIADNNIDELERKYLDVIVRELGLPEDFIKSVTDWYNEYMGIVRKGILITQGKA